MEQTGRYVKASFAAGCFWDVESAFRKVDGVLETVTGYTGGLLSDPCYEQVESGTTGHVEVVQLKFDPSVTTFEDILGVFFTIHDPFGLTLTVLHWQLSSINRRLVAMLSSQHTELPSWFAETNPSELVHHTNLEHLLSAA